MEEPSPDPLPGEGLYFLLGPACSLIHCAVARDLPSVATRVMHDRLVCHLYSSGTALSGSFHSAADAAYSSAFSLPKTP